ncbi:hypothetical protein L2D08_17010 [Domibacillus sp. PGB-M46]|uniref:hypothetical protein n=1 Tax=Domibacillus sp. PGB-M46 TaxID=2910255 RepID=UPI001F57BFCE|nr:hypothetical protein [Domibacillus sp. PGB-M46]MCI2256055.1 hypothetical protein [Domibacillus sp. PGB-M46]
MRGEITELKWNTGKSFLWLQNYLDDFDSTLVFVRFLHSFKRENDQEKGLPFIKCMTLLKEPEPNVFRLLRKYREDDPLFSFLNAVPANPQQAASCLQPIYECKRGER